MAQTYTGNIFLSLQAVDNVSGETLFNNMINNLSKANLNGASYTAVANLTSISGTIYSTGVFGFFIQNLGTNNLTITWQSGGTTNHICVLQQNGIILIFQPLGTQPILNITYTLDTVPGIVQFAVWE